MSKNEILMAVRNYADLHLRSPEFVPGKTRVPASGASLNPDDVATLTEAVLQLWYTDHKFCAKFRRGLGEYFLKNHVTLCNSGSSATLLALSAALEVYPYKDYVITTATNFPTAIAAIYQTGQIPIYIDIDPDTLSPNFEQYQSAIKDFKGKISGVILPHTLGFPFDEQKFDEICPGFFIADCCDAVGAYLNYEGKPPHVTGVVPVGTYSDLMTLSFFPAHHIMAGEGGAVLTNNKELKTVVDSFASWGRCCWCAPGQDNTCGKRFEWEWEKLPKGYDHKYTFCRLGYNMKMTEWQAALGFSQLSRVSTFVESRKENFSYLLNNLLVYRDYLDLITIVGRYRASPFGFPIVVDTDKFTTQELIAYLEEHKVSTRRIFSGNIIKQPGFSKLPNKRFDLAGSDKLMEDGFWVGCHPALTKEMLDYVVSVFDKFFKERGL
jgi:CDP-6-deoxy-D-xylo-4-hexulose-3-dehydrase